jgi:hypothetical protein
MPNRLLPTFGVAAILAGCAPTMETELGPARAIVVLNCGATPQGIARDCRVVREEPAGFGYGLHAKHGAEGRHDLNVEGGNEIWTPETRVEFTIRFAPAGPPRASSPRP